MTPWSSSDCWLHLHVLRNIYMPITDKYIFKYMFTSYWVEVTHQESCARTTDCYRQQKDLICTLYHKQSKNKLTITSHGKVYNINHENTGQTNIRNKFVYQQCNVIESLKAFLAIKVIVESLNVLWQQMRSYCAERVILIIKWTAAIIYV